MPSSGVLKAINTFEINFTVSFSVILDFVLKKTIYIYYVSYIMLVLQNFTYVHTSFFTEGVDTYLVSVPRNGVAAKRLKRPKVLQKTNVFNKMK